MYDVLRFDPASGSLLTFDTSMSIGTMATRLD